LDHLQIEPCLLHFGPHTGRADAFDGGDCALADRAHGQETGAHRRTVHMHGAGTALRDTASELGAGEPEDIAQYPEKRHIGRSIDIFYFVVDPQTDHVTLVSPRRWQASASDGSL
jgi:hypothetical protein